MAKRRQNWIILSLMLMFCVVFNNKFNEQAKASIFAASACCPHINRQMIEQYFIFRKICVLD